MEWKIQFQFNCNKLISGIQLKQLLNEDEKIIAWILKLIELTSIFREQIFIGFVHKQANVMNGI